MELLRAPDALARPNAVVDAPDPTLTEDDRSLHELLSSRRASPPTGRQRLRIGVVAPPWFEIPPRAYGGIEAMVYHLVEGLVERGHEVILVAAGARHTSARMHCTFERPPSERLGESFPEVAHALAAAEVLSDTPLDIVHDNSFAGPLVACRYGAPTVVTAHGPVTGEFGDRYYARLGPGVGLIAISDAQMRLAPHLPWLGRVHNAIPVLEFPFREDKDDYVLFLGRMSPEKGAHLAIDAARAAGLPLVMAAKCREGAERAYFEAEVAPRLGPGVTYVGEADLATKKDLLARARCLVSPVCWEEPFGLVMAEALACGTPVVALRRGSVPEIVEHGTTGLICDSPDELPAALHRVEECDPVTCRRSALERFDVAIMVSGYEAMYRRALRTVTAAPAHAAVPPAEAAAATPA